MFSFLNTILVLPHFSWVLPFLPLNPKFRRVAPGLYAVLSVLARRRYGRRLEELGREEVRSLLYEVLRSNRSMADRLVELYCEDPSMLGGSFAPSGFGPMPMML